MEKESKIKLVYLGYYSRKEIKKTIFEFCKKRETIPKYYDFFGKRPDRLEYEDDVYNLAKKGATSFHCSQELWGNPLNIKTEKNLNELREGWDFLIDIDSKYFDYAKISAKIIINALKFHGIRNFGIKFSGSKGFHIIIPWKAFPEEYDGVKTKNMFPEWPRIIAKYLQEEFIKKNLESYIEKNAKEDSPKEIFYLPTNEKALEGFFYEFVCEKCKTKITSFFDKKTKKRVFKCSVCKGLIKKIKEEKIYFSPDKKFNSIKNKEMFKEKINNQKDLNCVDLVLVAPRHLFRTPYSLHEKTSLCSCVLEEKDLENFSPNDAKPENIKIKNFYPIVTEEEAKKLLINALDWEKRKEKKDYTLKEKKEIDLSGIKIDESYFPPTILKILQGIKEDGRKRALTILLSFFVSLNLSKEYIEEKINEWNKKNYQPLKEGYINSQISWFLKNKRLPPNYDRSIYKELGVLEETEGFKNPINYTISKILKKELQIKNNKKIK